MRGLRLKPGFALAVIVTLGLGIGANATMFGIVDRLLFRPPHFLIAPDRASRLYFATTDRGKEEAYSETGYSHYVDLRDGTTSFDAMTPFYENSMAIGTGDATRSVHVGISSADLWRMFAIKPVIGRFFTADEDVPPNGSQVVVLSYAFWQTEFGGRASAIGSPLQMDATKYTIIGVAPEGFNGFERDPLVAFIPISARMAGQGDWYKTYNMTWFDLFARRKAGVAPEVAAADLNHAYQQSYKKQADASRWTTRYEIAKPRAFAGPVLEDRGPNEGSDAKVATWLGGCCRNGAAHRLCERRESASRSRLEAPSRDRGADRARREPDTSADAVDYRKSDSRRARGNHAGLAIAQWGGGIMRRTLLAQAGQSSNAFTDSRLLVFAGVLVAIVGLLTGLVPAFQAGRQDVASALKAGAREGTVHRSRVRGALLVGQAALSVVLLVGAGLFLRSLEKVQHVRMGYDADRLMWVSLNARGVEFDSIQGRQLRERLRERAQHIPGIEHAARALNVPFRSTYESVLYVAGIDSVSKLGRYTLQAVDADFFSTMGTRLLRGRAITADDRASSPRVMVVGESMAKKLWPTEDAIGKCVRIASDTMPCTTVVGIAEDVRRGSMRETQMHYYLSIAQHQPSEGVIFLRSSGPAAAKTDEVRRALHQLMPGASYIGVTPMSSVVASQTRSWKMGAVMFAIFGALALVLAAIGLYSVIAYNVTQRTHEMGVRVALGAQSGDVIGLIVREGLRIVVPGVALGAVIALVAGRWVAPLLFGDVAQGSTGDGDRDRDAARGRRVRELDAAALRAARVDPERGASRGLNQSY